MTRRRAAAGRVAGPPADPAAGVPAAGGTAPGVPAVLARLLPYVTVAVAAVVPLATGLYLVTTTAWTLAERALFGRPGHHP
jgi:YidC/Oxa1 family membrane protein insertase